MMREAVESLVDIENRADISRITCGWKKPELPLDVVWRYWRDVHSPAIARRAGVYEYRHFQFDAVSPDALAPVTGIEYGCNPAQQLMWLSDVRYRDQAGLDAFGASPGPEARALLLNDIELIVHQSTTYKCIGEAARTLADTTGNPAPQGPVAAGHLGLFFRQRADEAALHRSVRAIAERWSRLPTVKRLRVHLFEAPDMEAEKRGGYPIKTHPKELQYQAWIDIVLDSASASRGLTIASDEAASIGTIHAYPVLNLYTVVYNGRPTLMGLRGYPAYEAITALKASNHRQPSLLEWMYGPVATGGPLEPESL